MLDALEMWIWKRMKKIAWTDRKINVGRETINSENNFKKEKELDWSRDKRRGFVEGSH